ncbi:MAG TPA: 2-C-methyl-D-erythritol 2,4-cyclodiphosphate synthase [Candidatus Acidoferrales bacterium]|nr:2-C-methyl-D-erythritol 2,4-cyclodiphosphate synthase [Candidatus Acidoferrales bacterium]
MRVGIGYDVHPLVAGRPLILGGVELSSERGLEGYSDADALCHAVIDALLGAAALGDIGQHFPPGDPQYEGISSLELVAMAAAAVEEAGYRVANVDSTVVAQEPMLSPHLADMARNLADRLGLEPGGVSVKATSPERLGALGRQDGIAAQAVVLLESSE